jgi:geranylgeranyl pyrophosphate synthase
VADGAAESTGWPAAVELAYAACLIQRDVLEEEEDGSRPSRSARDARSSWGNRFAVMAANDLMVHAYALVADLSVSVSAVVSETTAEIALANITGPQGRLDVAPIYGLACRLGAMLGGAGDSAIDGATRFGRSLGRALQDPTENARAALLHAHRDLEGVPDGALKTSLLALAAVAA